MALLLCGCTITYLPSQPPALADSAGPVPPVKPLLDARIPRDLRQIIMAGLQETGQPVQIGNSVNGYEINAHRFGTGPVSVMLIGGIHGGFEANTVTLMEAFIELLQEQPELIPEEISVYIIPNMNPDGYAIQGIQGRVNSNRVDLNRNWDCRWTKSAGLYRNAFYRTGAFAFSEPESRSVRNFVEYVDGQIVVFYHNHGGFIFYGDCGGEDGSLDLARAVKEVTGYPIWNPTASLGDPAKPAITGDATDYFDRIGLRAIGIELTTYDESNLDWQQSYDGLLAILAYAAAQ